MAAVGTYQVRFDEKIVKNVAKVKNHSLNVTDVRDSDFKNAFHRIFNFIVGILRCRLSAVIRHES